jgi:hypothetical protein
MSGIYFMNLRNNHRYNPSKATRRRFESSLVWEIDQQGHIFHKFIVKPKGFWFGLRREVLLRSAQLSTESLLQHLLDESIGDFDHAVGLANAVIHASNAYQWGQVNVVNQSEFASRIALGVSATSTFP